MPVDFSRLKAQLLISGLQQRDKPLYQVIDQLITAFIDLNTIVSALSTGSGTGFIEWDVLTDGDVTNPQIIYANGEVIMTHTP